jgi:hypothetical protein
MSINTSENGWINFLRKNEATIRYLIIANKAKKSTEDRLFKIVVEILKKK